MRNDVALESGGVGSGLKRDVIGVGVTMRIWAFSGKLCEKGGQERVKGGLDGGSVDGGCWWFGC